MHSATGWCFSIYLPSTTLFAFLAHSHSAVIGHARCICGSSSMWYPLCKLPHSLSYYILSHFLSPSPLIVFSTLLLLSPLSAFIIIAIAFFHIPPLFSLWIVNICLLLSSATSYSPPLQTVLQPPSYSPSCSLKLVTIFIYLAFTFCSHKLIIIYLTFTFYSIALLFVYLTHVLNSHKLLFIFGYFYFILIILITVKIAKSFYLVSHLLFCYSSILTAKIALLSLNVLLSLAKCLCTLLPCIDFHICFPSLHLPTLCHFLIRLCSLFSFLCLCPSLALLFAFPYFPPPAFLQYPIFAFTLHLFAFIFTAFTVIFTSVLFNVILFAFTLHLFAFIFTAFTVIFTLKWLRSSWFVPV